MKKGAGKKGSHLTIGERRQIAALHDEGFSPYKIGKIIGRASNTVRNELKRGTTTVIIKYFEKEKYFPDTGQAVYEKNRKRCRMPQKVESCTAFISYVEEQALKYKRSLASARASALEEGRFQEVEICSVGTLYTYVNRGMLRIKNIDLPEKLRRKPKVQKDRTHKRLKGKSIEERPETINNREEFGHWEIDLVIGKQSADDRVLLTLAERKTKKEIIRSIKGKTVEAVHRCIRKLRKEIPHFDKVFRSITTDNGSEFARLHELGEQLGIDVYYAHPYSSWERGQNENGNKIIRRFIPKGHMIKKYRKAKVQEIEDWMNAMRRKSLDWKTAEECFQHEVEKLLLETA